MQVQTILHAASTLLRLGGWAESQGPGDQKIGTYHLKYDSNKKKKPTSQDAFVLAERSERSEW